MTEITRELNSFLMWVGAEHYPTIQDYVNEAKAQGVSKRLPNKVMAAKMQQPNTVVFLAHDEGRHEECWACLRAETCKKCDGTKLVKTPWGPQECKACFGAGKAMVGTGGTLEVDGKVWTQRQWMGAMRRGVGKFNPKDHQIEKDSVCPECGGFGWMPCGKVFGMFVPQQLEYILRDSDTEKVRADMEAAGFVIKTTTEVHAELRRGCGKRQPGGVYAVTKTGLDESKVQGYIKALVDAGKIDPANVDAKGFFVEFLTPIEISGEKRFRGMKRWDLPANAARQELNMLLAGLDDDDDGLGA